MFRSISKRSGLTGKYYIYLNFSNTLCGIFLSVASKFLEILLLGLILGPSLHLYLSLWILPLTRRRQDPGVRPLLHYLTLMQEWQGSKVIRGAQVRTVVHLF